MKRTQDDTYYEIEKFYPRDQEWNLIIVHDFTQQEFDQGKVHSALAVLQDGNSFEQFRIVKVHRVTTITTDVVEVDLD